MSEVSVDSDELTSLRSRLRVAEEELAEWRRFWAAAEAEDLPRWGEIRERLKIELLPELTRERVIPDEALLTDRWAAALGVAAGVAAVLVVLLAQEGEAIADGAMIGRAAVYQQLRRPRCGGSVGNLAKVRVSNLRKAMEAQGIDRGLIETLPGRGYQIRRAGVLALTSWLEEHHPKTT